MAFTGICHHLSGREARLQAATFRASYYSKIEVGSQLLVERPEIALRLIAITSVYFCYRKLTLDCSESLSVKAATIHLALVGSLPCWAFYSWRLNCHNGYDSSQAVATEQQQLLLVQGL